jgi:hypothetical protein
MAGMKITLSSAMRARDVSRPQPHHETAAQAADTELGLSSTGPASRAAGGDQRRPAARPTAKTGPAAPVPAPGGPAPAGGAAAGSGVQKENAEPGAARSGGSRRHRSRRRGR